MKFYRCEHCGSIVTFLQNSGVPVMCCGQTMTELVPGASDGASEKHVPVVSAQGNEILVKVSSVEHPMLPEHHIVFIAIETAQGSQIKYLHPGEKPQARFALTVGYCFLAASAFCTPPARCKPK